ncbi:hypothetical protein [Coleofasciculus sp. G2-EDA-02]|uniref:hypothetical protein n=1 Tax=Coleofasciculus sp. G2-EDA-02 TaxID=3069529 RepID=UPI0032F82EA3
MSSEQDARTPRMRAIIDQIAKENVLYRSGCDYKPLRIRDKSCRMCLGLIRINTIQNNFVIFLAFFAGSPSATTCTQLALGWIGG